MVINKINQLKKNKISWAKFIITAFLSLFHSHIVMCGRIHPSLKQGMTIGKEREDKGSGDEFHN